MVPLAAALLCFYVCVAFSSSAPDSMRSLACGQLPCSSTRHQPNSQKYMLAFCCAAQALLWFRSPPRYFARCSRHTAQQQLAALEAFMAELGSLVALGAAGGIAWKQGGWPSYDCGCMPGAGAGLSMCLHECVLPVRVCVNVQSVLCFASAVGVAAQLCLAGSAGSFHG